ncbi:HIRAN domain-containing protein [Candidatus Saccharibacteria bacterium]|nr:HIRAN domain-containing protein [Candidatus Saccharibacteria bacterium]MBQ6461572.1 HIRAN domain-containing protein [Candidatus Saccharibacteria bacterium]
MYEFQNDDGDNLIVDFADKSQITVEIQDPYSYDEISLNKIIGVHAMPHFETKKDKNGFATFGTWHTMQIAYYDEDGDEAEIEFALEEEDAERAQTVADLCFKCLINGAESVKLSLQSKKNPVAQTKQRPVFFDDEGRYMRYYYDDVEVKGFEHRNIDINTISIDHPIYFDDEPDNEYDENAIKITYDDKFIGYIPKKPNLQRMVLEYGKDGVSRQVCGFVSLVDYSEKKIQVGLAFYEAIDSNMDVIEAKLVKINDERDDNLTAMSEDEEIRLEYDEDKEAYIVNSFQHGLELGELSKVDTKKIKGFENEGYDIKAGITSLKIDNDNKHKVTIKVIAR